MVKAVESLSYKMNMVRSSVNSGESAPNPDEDTHMALFDWSWNAYSAVRSGRAPKTDALIENFLDGRSYDGVVYRGLSTRKPLDLRVGDVIDQKGISSWSQSEEVATRFATSIRPHHYLFVMEGGTKRGADITQWSAHPEEKEVTVSKRSLQEITRIDESERLTRYYVKEVY